MLTGMTISTRFTDNSPGPTLIGRVLLDPIKNRFRFGFKKKTKSGSDFSQKLGLNPNPARPGYIYVQLLKYIYIYIYIVITLPHLTLSSTASHLSLQLTTLTLSLTISPLPQRSSDSSLTPVSTLTLKSQLKRSSLAQVTRALPQATKKILAQAQPQSSIKHHENLHNPCELPLTHYRPTTVWVWFFFFFFTCFCEQNLSLAFFFFFFFFWCFVGGIFKFANFISGFAKFLGFVGFFCIDWFVRSWHPFGWQENCQENAMIILGLY